MNEKCEKMRFRRKFEAVKETADFNPWRFNQLVGGSHAMSPTTLTVSQKPSTFYDTQNTHVDQSNIIFFLTPIHNFSATFFSFPSQWNRAKSIFQKQVVIHSFEIERTHNDPDELWIFQWATDGANDGREKRRFFHYLISISFTNNSRTHSR